jgi:hypothetical protein
MARPSKSAPAQARARVDSSTSTAPDTADTTVFNVDFARTCLNASLTASQSMLEYVSQLQQVQGLLAAQTNLARQNLSRAMQSCNELFADLSRTMQSCNELFAEWLDSEAQLVEQAQAQTTNLTRGLIEDRSAKQKASAAAPQDSAVALYENAQTALTNMTQMWVEAVKSGATLHH